MTWHRSSYLVMKQSLSQESTGGMTAPRSPESTFYCRKNSPDAPTPGRFACFIFDEYPLGMVKNMFSFRAGWAFLDSENFFKALAEMLTGPVQA